MASKPLRPCMHTGCTELTRDGWCPKHKPKYKRKASAEYHGWYQLSIWTDDLRPTQLLAEPWCRECAAEGKRVRATVVDHVVPHEGNWDLFRDRSNLQSLCKHHHNRKTMIERQKRERFAF